MKWINLIIITICFPIILLGISVAMLLSSNIISLNIVFIFISTGIIYFNLRSKEKQLFYYIYLIYPIILLLFSLFICNYSIYILISSISILFLSSQIQSNLKYNMAPYIYIINNVYVYLLLYYGGFCLYEFICSR